MYATLAAILLMFLGFVYPKMSRPADILRSVLWAVLLAGAGLWLAQPRSAKP